MSIWISQSEANFAAEFKKSNHKIIFAHSITYFVLYRNMCSLNIAYWTAISKNSNCKVSECEIQQARLLTLATADKIDKFGAKEAKNLIAMIKIQVPQMCCDVADRAIQIHGGEGVSQLTPLASMYAHMRTLRLADGPDEVHRRAVARYELGKYMS